MSKDKIAIAFCGAAIIGLVVAGILMDRHPDNVEIEQALKDKGYTKIQINELDLKEKIKNIFSCGKYDRMTHIETVDAQGHAASGISCQDRYLNRTQFNIAPK